MAVENQILAPVNPLEKKPNQEQKTSHLDKGDNTENKTLTDLLRVEKSSLGIDSEVINSTIAKLSPENILRLPLWQKTTFLNIYGNVLTEENKQLIQNNLGMGIENQATEAIKSGALNSMTSVGADILQSVFQTVKETAAAMGDQFNVTKIPEQATSYEKLERSRMVSVVGGIEDNIVGLEKGVFDEAPKEARAKVAQGLKETKK